LFFPQLPTITLAEARPGDVVFCHSAGAIGRGIRIAQRIAILGFFRAIRSLFRPTPANAPWTHNHVAVLVASNGTPYSSFVYQAQAAGTERVRLSDVAPGGSFVIVSADSFRSIDGRPIDRARILAEGNRRLGEEYGFVTIASEVVNLTTPRALRLDFRRPGSLICSAYAALMLHAGGAAIDVDLYNITPAELKMTAAGGPDAPALSHLRAVA
jgi:hypothetical protein